jgi:YidC/Oxa1 family membrane protein insertase
VEKRLIAFLVVSTVVIFGWMQLAAWLNPPRPKPPTSKSDGTKQPESPTATEKPEKTSDEKPEDVKPAEPRTKAPQRWISLGSVDPQSKYRLLVTANSRGGTIERIELNHPEYRDLEDTSGYLGYLALTNEKGGGARVNVVGAGTPAALAVTKTGGVPPGLRPDDIILAADAQPIGGAEDLREFLGEAKPGEEYKPERGKKPGDQVELTVRRQSGSQSQDLTFTVTLGDRPMQIIQPEWTNPDDPSSRNPASFRLTLESIGKSAIGLKGEEIAGLPSLYNEHWEVNEIENGVEFVFRLGEAEMQELGQAGALEVVKRYRLKPSTAEALAGVKGYDLDFEIEIRNLGETPHDVAYRLQGPNGLPLEGWWYLNKLHPKLFQSAGARDVIWEEVGSSHRVFGCPYIVKQYDKEARPELFDEQVVMSNAGVDAQYFSTALIPAEKPEAGSTRYAYQRGWAAALETLPEKDASRRKTTNVSYVLDSVPHRIEPGGSYRESFTLFAGPKHPDIMDAYGLSDYIEYGWFWWVAGPMLHLLHFFESFLFNYGLAIVLLTVLVRGLMHPLGRKMAMNAKKMQELAPEMKAIAEKYKNDMQKRSEAQQELFRKHNYNPFGGCLVLFLQMPIFLGLYRGLAVDIELRGASLIPGMQWCSNLAGPDSLFYWEPFLFGWIADPARGWLGPYFNLLPMVTVALFLVHQKLFMPPATDEQSRLQQQIMMYMTIFMGVMFFRVPAGLCVYFIVSSLWGIVERTWLLPSTKTPSPAAPLPQKPAAKEESKQPKKLPFGLGGNGTSKPMTPQERRKQRQKRK